MNYPLIIGIEEVFEQMDLHHSIYNKKAIRAAYEYAKIKHAGIKRGTGEDYIMHPLRVAKILAGWGCESDWVCAGLLHDVVEDVADVSLKDIEIEFGADVSKYVDGVTKIDKNCPPYDKLTKQERHNLTDAKLQAVKNDASLYIKFADRMDNLLTLEGLPEDKRLSKAINTRDIIIPLAYLVGAEKITSDLEELCFPLFHPTESSLIKTAFEKYKKTNLYGFSATLNTIKNAFWSSSMLSVPTDLSTARKYICDFKFNKRAHVSIYRQLMLEADNIRTEFNKHIRKDNIAWYDMTLILSNSISNNSENVTTTDVFYKIYEDTLLEKGIYIIRSCYTTRRDSKYILMSDTYGNLFRLFIKTEEEFHLYEVGDIINSFNNLNLNNINTTDPRDTYNKTIKVFKRNGASCWIEAGATVLDFAFNLHTEIGLHFDYATLKGSLTHLPAYHRLAAGDEITIHVKDEETVDLSWFKYLKTADAVQKLYKYYNTPKNIMNYYNKITQSPT